MTDLKIDKGIPIPSKKSNGLDFWQKLEISDSALIEYSRSNAGLAGALNGRLRPKKFIGRTVQENGSKAIRVWRIE